MHDEHNSESQNALLLASGIALIAFGAGLLAGHPELRRTVMTVLTPLLPDEKGAMSGGIAGLLPDVERYMRIKSM